MSSWVGTFVTCTQATMYVHIGITRWLGKGVLSITIPRVAQEPLSEHYHLSLDTTLLEDKDRKLHASPFLGLIIDGIY